MFVVSLADATATRINADVLLTNLLLTLLVILLFAVTSYIFNSTMDENRATIVAWRARVAHWLWPITRPIQALDRGLKRGVEAARLTGAARVAIVLGLSGLIYGFLDPNFGLNPPSVVLFVALVIGLGISTYLAEGGSTFLAVRRHRVASSVRLLGAGILDAIVCVAASRLVDFRPGFVFGFIASSVILSPVALGRRASAELVVVPAILTLVVALLAWLALTPLRAASVVDESWLPVLLESIAGVLFIGGLEAIFFSMIPLSFMDGAAVWKWNKLAWAGLFGTSTFLFWQLVINREAKYLEASKQSSVLVCLALLAVYGGGTLLVWSYFRYRRWQATRREPAAG